MIKHIPNFIILLNLFSGCIAIIFASQGQLSLASFFVILGIFFDFFDGLAARWLNVRSELGLQLDSLADMVTSGVAPGFIMFQLLSKLDSSHHGVRTVYDIHTIEITSYLPFIGFLITLAAAYRLAKFNIDSNQTTSFIGLPTPANALLIISIPLILDYQTSERVTAVILTHWFLISITLLGAFLMNANLKLFALKFKSFNLKGNEIRYIFLLLSLILILTTKFIALPLIILIYIIISVIVNFKEGN